MVGQEEPVLGGAPPVPCPQGLELGRAGHRRGGRDLVTGARAAPAAGRRNHSAHAQLVLKHPGLRLHLLGSDLDRPLTRNLCLALARVGPDTPVCSSDLLQPSPPTAHRPPSTQTHRLAHPLALPKPPTTHHCTTTHLPPPPTPTAHRLSHSLALPTPRPRSLADRIDEQMTCFFELRFSWSLPGGGTGSGTDAPEPLSSQLNAM